MSHLLMRANRVCARAGSILINIAELLHRFNLQFPGAGSIVPSIVGAARCVRPEVK
jgi:hypothetical protein